MVCSSSVSLVPNLKTRKSSMEKIPFISTVSKEKGYSRPKSPCVSQKGKREHTDWHLFFKTILVDFWFQRKFNPQIQNYWELHFGNLKCEKWSYIWILLLKQKLCFWLWWDHCAECVGNSKIHSFLSCFADCLRTWEKIFISLDFNQGKIKLLFRSTATEGCMQRHLVFTLCWCGQRKLSLDAFSKRGIWQVVGNSCQQIPGFCLRCFEANLIFTLLICSWLCHWVIRVEFKWERRHPLH